MIYFLLEIATILSYMLNGILGIIISSIMFFIIWFNKKNNIENKIITSLILSVPIYNIGILGINMHHMFSWYNIFLIIYNIFLITRVIKGKLKFSKKVFIIFLILLVMLTINLIMEEHINNAISDYLQILIMLFTILTTYQLKNKIIDGITYLDTEEWIQKVNITIIAVAICTIIQFLIYNIFKIKIGYITVFTSRITYDLLFKGYSVLSLLLGIGIILGINNVILKNEKIFNNIVMIILCITATIINSSRTGLVSAILISAYIVTNKICKKYRNVKINKKYVIKILASFIIVVLVATFTYMLMKFTRGSENIFSANGRITTYVNAIKYIFESPKNLFCGIGLSTSDYEFILPHNLILELTLKLGIIFSFLIIYLIIKLLKNIANEKRFKYVIWHILLSSMLITGFYEMTFIILYVIIEIIIAQMNKKEIKEGKDYEKTINKYSSTNL